MNNSRSEAMFSTAMFYTMMSVIFSIVSIATKKMFFLDISMFIFIASVIALAISMAFDKVEVQSPFVSLVAFILMIPFVLFFSIVGAMFYRDEGGDYDDEP